LPGQRWIGSGGSQGYPDVPNNKYSGLRTGRLVLWRERYHWLDGAMSGLPLVLSFSGCDLCTFLVDNCPQNERTMLNCCSVT